MKSKQIIYINNKQIGLFKGENIHQLNNSELDSFYKNIGNSIVRKERARRISSISIASILLIVAIILALLTGLKKITLLGGGWFNYPYFLLLLFVIWFVLYFLIGLIFYKKINYEFYFQGKENEALLYASSKYYKWVNRYKDVLANTSFYKLNKNKKEGLFFGLYKPSIKNIIYNGKVACNVHYFYLSYRSIKLIFLPGFILYIDGTKSFAFKNADLNVTTNENEYKLEYNNKELISFKSFEDFDKSFFTFKY